jgi:hypothetical protein
LYLNVAPLNILLNFKKMDNNKQTIPNEIRAFIEAVLADTGMIEPDEEVKEEMVKELYVRLDEYITAAIVENLPEEQVDEFIKMNEEKKPMDEIQKFLIDKMPNSKEVFENAFSGFRNMYLNNVNLHRNKASILNNQDSQTN